MQTPAEAQAELMLGMRKFSDVVKTTTPWTCTHADLVNRNVVILSFHDIVTNIGAAYLAECEVDGKNEQVLIGGMVLKKQLEEMQEALPIAVTVKRRGRYYTFADPE